MKVREFLLERYFAKYEFTTEHMLSASDCETLSVVELLQGADGEVMDLWSGLRLSYTESRGHPLLLREIAERESMPPENVLVMNPEEGVFLTLNALLDASDHVIVLSPCYQSLYEIPKSIGCEVTRWYLKKEGGEWRLDLRFRRSRSGEHQLLVVNFPHNPTGFAPSREQMDEIAELPRGTDSSSSPTRCTAGWSCRPRHPVRVFAHPKERVPWRLCPAPRPARAQDRLGILPMTRGC